jgi:DNA-binding NarL/FixJ family response regulator
VVSPRRKVLLVDDSELVRALVVHALGNAGFEVSTIDDPSGLAAALARDTPDLVLVDATFPGTDDSRLVELVAPHAAGRRIVVFSDRPEADVQALAARMGASGTVPKDDVSRLPGRLDALFAAH